MSVIKQMTGDEIRRTMGARTFSFAHTRGIFAFPEELCSSSFLPEKLVYAHVVKHFNEKCFENDEWIRDPYDVYEMLPPALGVSVKAVCFLVDRLFKNNVSATLYYTAMPDGSWLLGVVRSLKVVKLPEPLARAA